MSVAVIVIVAGREVQLRRTLDGVGRQEHRPDEVVVVQMRPQQAPPTIDGMTVRVIDVPAVDGPLPLGAARNAGAAASSASRLVFLDVDCIPDPRLVGRYVEVLDDSPGALVCGPVRYLRDGWATSADAIAGRDRALHDLSDAPRHRQRIGECERIVDNRHELFWSLAFGVDRPTWNALGGFDEGFTGYGAEDTDLGFRARTMGVPMVWFGGTGVAYHQWHEPSRLDPDRAAEIVANARRFRERWGDWPMKGWLSELHQLGRLQFDESADTLDVVA